MIINLGNLTIAACDIAGKTHTMEGTPENRGVNYRMLTEAFTLMSERAKEMWRRLHSAEIL